MSLISNIAGNIADSAILLAILPAILIQVLYDFPSCNIYDCPSYNIYDCPSYNIYNDPSYNIYDGHSYNSYDSIPCSFTAKECFADTGKYSDIWRETKDKFDGWLWIESGSADFYGGIDSRAGVDFCQVEGW